MVAMLALTFSMNAQLSDYSKELKSSSPETYKPIKDYAVREWGSDHKMIVYTINKQTKARNEVITLVKAESFDKEAMLNCMMEWSEDINGETFYNWSMTLYTYKKQMKNKDY